MTILLGEAAGLTGYALTSLLTLAVMLLVLGASFRVSTGNIGYGLTLELNSDVVAQVVDLKGPNIRVKAVDISNNSSPNGFREFIPGLGDGGEITFNVIANTDNRAALFALLRTSTTCVVTINDTHTWTPPSVFITAIDDGEPLDDAQTLDVTLKISGKPVYD